MITFRWCENCQAYRKFVKVGKNDSHTLPWVCNQCGAEVKEFPNPKRWPYGGIKSRKELK